MDNKKQKNNVLKPITFAGIGATLLTTGLASDGMVQELLSNSSNNNTNIAQAKKNITVDYTYDISPYVLWNIENPTPGRIALPEFFPNGSFKMVNVVGKGSNNVNNLRFDSTHPIADDSGNIIWCIQSGVLVQPGQKISGKDMANSDQFNNMGIVAYHGYYKNYGEKYVDHNKMTKNQLRDYLYTVRLLQEMGEPNTVGKEKIIGVGGYDGTYNNGIIENFKPSDYGISVDGYYAFKDRMMKEVDKYKNGPKLDLDGTVRPGKTIRVKDLNGALDRYDISGTPKGVTAKIINKDTLELSLTADAVDGNIEFTYKIPAKYNEVPFYYEAGSSQNLTNARVGKKTQTRLNVKKTPTFDTPPGDPIKVDQYGKPVEGAKFKITNHEDGIVTEVVTDAKGSLRYAGYLGDRITIEEIEAPIGYILSPDHVKFDVVLTNDGWNKFEPYNPKSEYLGTKARNDEKNNQVFVPEKKVVLKDTIEYRFLDTKQEYTAVGWLMDKKTGEPYVDKNGNRIEKTMKFTPSTQDGTFAMDFEFDAEDLRNAELVAFEELYIDGTLVAEHKDINDKEQTVTFTDPKIGTKASSTEDGGKYIDAIQDTDVTDTVGYEDLNEGDNYRLKGTLMDKSTGQPVVVNGKEVTATKEFKASGKNGEVDINFNFDARGLEGKELVVFEELERQNSKTGEWYFNAEHKDINDKGQTFYVTNPEIKTTATSKDDGGKHLHAVSDVDMKDVVEYKDLLPGKTYKLSGQVMDKVTGEPLKTKDGKPVTNSVEFKTPGKEGEKPVSGKVELDFNFNAEQLEGKDLVVFEEVERQHKGSWKWVAEHKDINDMGQTVHVTNPEIKTTATSVEDGGKYLDNVSDTDVKDVVEYKNLLPGKKYKLSGQLMDKKTGKPVETKDGKPAKNIVEFTAPGKSGEAPISGKVELDFNFTAEELEGKDLVVFEEVEYSHKGKWKWVAEHKDINDESQTVHVANPKIRTTAISKEDGGKYLDAISDTDIKDIVEYENLLPGKKYKLTGQVMDKVTGKPVETKDGKPVQNTIEFTAPGKEGEKPVSGKVELDFNFTAEELEGKDLVVFEELERNHKDKWKWITEHKDINDKGQTVHVLEPEIGTTAISTEDGGKYLDAISDTDITDIVEYKNLLPGKKYKMSGVMMDKETNKPVETKDGKPVENFIEFTTKGEPGGEPVSGTAEIEFNLTAEQLEGKKLVAFEELERYHKEKYKWVVEHKDIEDEDQTVHITNPKIGTTAKSIEDGSDYLDAVDDVGITDTVVYEELLPGKTYKMSGVMMDKETGKPVLTKDGDEVRETVEFKAPGKEGEKPVNGEVKLDFYFNAEELQAKDLVAFEELERLHKEKFKWVAEHKDIEDESQTVHVTDPTLKTTALNIGAFDEKKSDPWDEVTITDIVEYKDLLPNKSYKIEGILMNKATGEELVIKGKTVEGETEFKTGDAEEGEDLISGKVDVIFELDASNLRGYDTVVFEDLFRDKPVINPELKDEDSEDEQSDWVFITDHRDINDGDQTIHINDPTIELVKEISQDVYKRGDVLTYEFTVSNPGDVIMTNLKFTDSMFEGYEIPFDELEPGETKTFTIDYTASNKDVTNNYLYNEAKIEGETPDGWEEEDEDNAVATSDHEIKIVKTPKECCNTCPFPNIVIDIDNENILNGVITDEGKYIAKEDMKESEIKEVDKVIETVLEEVTTDEIKESKETVIDIDKKVEEKDSKKDDEKVEEKDNKKTASTFEKKSKDNGLTKEEQKKADKEAKKQSEKQKEDNPELAETGINNPRNQAIIFTVAFALLGAGTFLFARNRKNKED